MDITELPNIDGITANDGSRIASDVRSRQESRISSLASHLATGFFSIIISAGVAVAVTLVGKDTLLTMAGIDTDSKQPDKIELAINEHSRLIADIESSLHDAKKEIADLHAYSDASAFDASKLTQRVSTLERFASQLEKKIADHKQAQQKQVAAQIKQVAQAKPKPAPVIPMLLISIRNQAGTPLVSLRDGLDKSDLLMPGDTWRGWTLLDANPSSKVARFKVRDQVQELRL